MFLLIDFYVQVAIAVKKVISIIVGNKVFYSMA